MAGGPSSSMLRDIQTLFDTGRPRGCPTVNFWSGSEGRRDEAALELLVLRHGPMGSRVCRNVLHDPNDAQDAFQATFLVLVRHCGSVRKRDSVGSWLYGVASRVAARARVEAARRRSRGTSRRIAGRGGRSSEDADPDRAEFGPVVQEEVRRLPEKYRAVVVLCYWQGLTHEQAAGTARHPAGHGAEPDGPARDLLRRRRSVAA